RDLADLYGPTVQLSLDGRPSHPSVPEVRRALTTWPLRVTGQPSSVEYLRGAVDTTWRTWHTSRQQRSEVGRMLPGLIEETQRAARLHEGDDRREALGFLPEGDHQAQALLARPADGALGWLRAARGMSSARDAGKPLAIAGSTWYAAHLRRAVGRSEEALVRLADARELIEPGVAEGPPEYAAMLADLWLCSALTRARNADQSAWSDWEHAEEVVRRALPADYVHPWTRVGPVLVDVCAVMMAIDLGDPDEAQRRAHALDPDAIPSTERRARHLMELARAADLNGSWRPRCTCSPRLRTFRRRLFSSRRLSGIW